MKAVCWNGTHKVNVETVPDPQILNDHDAIVRVTLSAICGSDLHLYDGYVPTMEHGDILGHEFMGEVMEVGPEVTQLRVGDRVVVPAIIACGHCQFCQRGLWSLCDNTNPNAAMQEAMYGYATSGLYGYSHLYGGYAGGQAEYVRVPFANIGPLKITNGVSDEQVLFLGDILPTGFMAAENCNIMPGDVVAVWGCGAVGQFAIMSALLLGAERVIAIDRVLSRLRLAAAQGADTIDYAYYPDVVEALKSMTGGRGPDACIDAVGMEAHGVGLDYWYDRTMQATRMETDRPTALRQAMQACRKGGTLSIPGVYGGFIDKVPFGAAFNKGLTIRMGQTHMHRYMRPLLELIQQGRIDPSVIITHRMRLEEAPEAYELFKHKEDDCLKVVLRP